MINVVLFQFCAKTRHVLAVIIAADRSAAHRVFLVSCLLAAVCNAAALLAPQSLEWFLGMRFSMRFGTGFLMAAVGFAVSIGSLALLEVLAAQMSVRLAVHLVAARAAGGVMAMLPLWRRDPTRTG